MSWSANESTPPPRARKTRAAAAAIGFSFGHEYDDDGGKQFPASVYLHLLARFVYEARKPSLSTINCEGWSISIVVDFQPILMWNRTSCMALLCVGGIGCVRGENLLPFKLPEEILCSTHALVAKPRQPGSRLNWTLMVWDHSKCHAVFIKTVSFLNCANTISGSGTMDSHVYWGLFG